MEVGGGHVWGCLESEPLLAQPDAQVSVPATPALQALLCRPPGTEAAGPSEKGSLWWGLETPAPDNEPGLPEGTRV